LIILSVIKDVKNPLTKYKINFKTVYPELTYDQLVQLMNETYEKGLVFESFTQFKERSRNGKYVNIEKEGFRRTINQGPWPPSKNYYNIFLFGGSTTLGYGVGDNETIASYLQQLISSHINKEVKVYNFGRGYYYSTQERILFEEKLLSNFIPDYVIFIDGLNDCFYGKGEFHFKEKLSSLYNDPFSFSVRYLLDELPAIQALNKIIKIFNQKLNEGSIDSAYISSVIDRYINNKKVIEAICQKYNIKSIFIWQPIPNYKYDLQYHLFAKNINDNNPAKYIYPYMKEYVEKAEMGKNFIWCADFQEDMKKPLYVDSCHYSSFMSKVFSETIIERMKIRELLVFNSHLGR
jgi:hypothetical protein